MSLRTALLLALGYVLLLAVLALGVPLGLTTRDRVNAEVRSQSRSQADVVAATAADLLRGRVSGLQALARTSARSVRGRVVILDSRGRLLADSAGMQRRGQSYAARPEVRSALRGRAVQETRASRTLGERILATAVPIVRGGRPAGVVRVTQSVAAVDEAVRRAVLGLALLALIVLVVALGAGALIARRLTDPLRRLDATARLISGGDLDRRAPVEGTSEQRSLARAFNTMTARLGRALRAQRRFVADASHQLRTPLTGLRLHLEEAQAESREAPVRREIGEAIGEVDRLAEMVEELLVLSRAGERDAPQEDLDLGVAVREAERRWRRAAQERRMTVTASTNGPAPVHCSRPALDRAVDVLVENAVNYGAEGGEVELVASTHAIDVLDRGPGFAAGEEAVVVERFHRGTAGRAGPAGTGLGLPIARELARECGALLELSNRSDGGARATLRWEDAR